jgi:hypothetical protein
MKLWEVFDKLCTSKQLKCIEHDSCNECYTGWLEKELKKQICNSCATQRCYPDECEQIKEVKNDNIKKSS